MSTTRAAVASLVGVGLALGLGVAGAVAIYNTKDGQVQGSDTPEVQFPDTPTAALAVLDDDGALASLAVFSVRPHDGGDPGRGGTVVPVPVSVDASDGIGPERLPIDETVVLFGPATLREELPAVLGLDIDVVSAVSEAELADMLASIGPTEVALPLTARDTSGGIIVEAGVRPIDGATMAAILASRDSSLSAADEYENDVAIWRSIADAVGSGLDTPLTVTPSGTEPSATSAEEVAPLVGQLTAGAVAVQPLRFDPIVSVDRNPRGVDAVVLDRVEVALIFGHVAPGRVASPRAGYSFRLVSAFSDAQLTTGVDRLSVEYTAVKALLALDANVRSVETTTAGAPPATVIEVSNETFIAAAERLESVFGPVEVRVAPTQITGIDITVTLGAAYLDSLGSTAVAATTVGPEASVDAGATIEAGATDGIGASGAVTSGTVVVEDPVNEPAEGTS